MASLPFLDRDDAARQLAVALAHFRATHPVILAIPRGAVPMGRIVADALDGELDVVLVRKLGAPLDPEFAIGAVDEQGAVTLGEHPGWAGATNGYVQREAQRQLELIRSRRQSYRPGRPATALAGRTVIVLDDGLATGATMSAALKYARAQRPQRLVCAVPVAAPDSLAQVATLADEVVCLATPWPFYAVGQHYRRFTGISDAQVIEILNQTPAATPAPGAEPPRTSTGAAGDRRSNDSAGR